MIGIAVIGHGNWEWNLVRNFAEVPDAKVVSVTHLLPGRLALARPDIHWLT